MPRVSLVSAARRRAASRTSLLLVLALAACRTWRAAPLPVAGAPDRAVRGHLRATRADGSRVELARARVARDTLRGEPRRAGDDGARPPVAVPLDSLRRLETRRVSVARTLGLYFGVMGAVFLGQTVVGAANDGSRPR
jgi:hypothetical protein